MIQASKLNWGSWPFVYESLGNNSPTATERIIGHIIIPEDGTYLVGIYAGSRIGTNDDTTVYIRARFGETTAGTEICGAYTSNKTGYESMCSFSSYEFNAGDKVSYTIHINAGVASLYAERIYALRVG